MSTCDKNWILSCFKKAISKSWLEQAKKKNPAFAEAIENIKENDISYSDPLKACIGYVSGNATGVGSKTQNDVESTYTISLDFRSDTFLFGNNKDLSPVPLIEAAQNFFPELKKFEVKSCSEARYIAENCGKKMCVESLNSLNYFKITTNRLNKYSLITDDEFTLPMRQINAKINYEGKEKIIKIGYWYINEGEFFKTDIDRIPATKKQKLIIFGICALIVLILILLFAVIGR